MQQPQPTPKISVYHLKKWVYVIATIIAISAGAAIILSFKTKDEFATGRNLHFTIRDSIESKAAFLKVYEVLMSPRCMNCHPSGDIPLQGDDSHLHLQGVKRGPEGKGLYALKCANCHQSQNLAGLHMPPGNPNWGLPPANMKMVFQGKTPHDLAEQLLDKKRNGRKSVKALINHITSDPLVLAGWTPADGLAMPPLSHGEFVKAFNEWISKGAVSP